MDTNPHECLDGPGDQWLNPKMKKANDATHGLAEKEMRLTFFDIEAAMLGDDGTPFKDLLLKDRLYMTLEGYQTWLDMVTPKLVVVIAKRILFSLNLMINI